MRGIEEVEEPFAGGALPSLPAIVEEDKEDHQECHPIGIDTEHIESLCK